MSSLRSQVVQQRHTLVARHREMQHRAARLRAHRCHPLVLVPAFICGVMVERAAPGYAALHGLAAALSRLTNDIGKLDAAVQMLAPILLHPSDAASADTIGAQSSPTPADKAPRQQPT